TIFVKNSTKTTLFTNVGGGTGFGGAIAIAVTNNGSLNIGLDGKGAVKMENCILQQNTAGSGGAIYAQTALVSGVSPLGSASLALDLRNNTLVGNRAVDKFGAFGTPGGAIEVEAFGSSGAPGGTSVVTGTLLNNIIRGNTSLGNPPSGDMIIT